MIKCAINHPELITKLIPDKMVDCVYVVFVTHGAVPDNSFLDNIPFFLTFISDIKGFNRNAAKLLTTFLQKAYQSILACLLRPRAPSQYPKRRLFVRSRKVSKPRDWYFKLSYRFEI